MKKIIRFILIVMIFLTCIQVSSALFLTGFPGLLGISFSSGSGISSGVSISSSSTIISTPATPAVAPQPASSSGETIPQQWIIGTREGNYFDPLSNTNWVYDKILKKFYSPTNGWFLVTQYSPDGTPFAQFYYDPTIALFIDMATGATILPGQSEGGGTSQQTAQQTTSTNTQSGAGTQQGGAPATQQMTPMNTQTGAGGQQGTPTTQQTAVPGSQGTPGTQQGGEQGSQQAGPDSSNPCRISCSDCPSGYCDDCNGNDKCDDTESASAATGSGQAQGSPDQGQANPPEDTGGISEDPQATIHYLELPPDSGILPVVRCESEDTCEFCLDTDKDGVCTISDCAILRSGSDPNGPYCVDCDRDGACDTDKKFMSDCVDLAGCSEAEYCLDSDNDGTCDSKSEGI